MSNDDKLVENGAFIKTGSSKRPSKTYWMNFDDLRYMHFHDLWEAVLIVAKIKGPTLIRLSGSLQCTVMCKDLGSSLMHEAGDVDGPKNTFTCDQRNNYLHSWVALTTIHEYSDDPVHGVDSPFQQYVPYRITFKSSCCHAQNSSWSSHIPMELGYSRWFSLWSHPVEKHVPLSLCGFAHSAPYIERALPLRVPLQQVRLELSKLRELDLP